MKEHMTAKLVRQSLISLRAAIGFFMLLFGLLLSSLGGSRSLISDIDTVLTARPAGVNAPVVSAKANAPLGDRDILTSSMMLKNTTIIEGAMTNRTSRWMPLLTGPLIAFLAAAVVGLWASHREESSAQLEGQWVGTVGDDFRFMRGEFATTWNGLSGRLHLQGSGELTLVKSRGIGNETLLEMKQGNERLVFTGHLTRDVMTGYVDWTDERMRFQIHRIVPVDRRRLEAYLGTYRIGSDWFRSIENCTAEFGWDQLIYVNPRNGARKALFPISGTTFFFGPGFLIPDPVEGTATFLMGEDGRVQNLLWEQAGSPATIAERAEPGKELRVARGDSASRCRPLPPSVPFRASLPYSAQH